MKIGVLADSHDNLPMLRKAMALFATEGVDTVVHAGDFIAPFAVKELLRFEGTVLAVFGNNDGEQKGIRKLGLDVTEPPRTVELGGRTVLLSHAPPEDPGPVDVIVSGHTHEVQVETGPPLRLNPGECGGWLSGRCTVALLDTDTLAVEIKEL